MKLTLEDFIANNIYKNEWIYEKYIKIYIRKSNRYINKKIISCLDIGSVEVNDNKQGRGIFKEFLNRFEEIAKLKNRTVFIENVLSDRFCNFFLKNGYLLVPNSTNMIPCFYKTIL